MLSKHVLPLDPEVSRMLFNVGNIVQGVNLSQARWAWYRASINNWVVASGEPMPERLALCVISEVALTISAVLMCWIAPADDVTLANENRWPRTLTELMDADPAGIISVTERAVSGPFSAR
jgi:hypothetical protein